MLENLTDEEFIFEASEIEDKPDKLPPGVIARVVFKSAQQADQKNRNGNVYPFEFLESAVQELNKRAGNVPVFMNASHPQRIRDATGKVIGIEEAPMAGPKGVAARIASASIDPETGKVGLVAEVADTTAGRDVLGLLKLTGGKIPVSSRSRGKARAGVHSGKFGRVEGNIIQKGFIMDTMDFVSKQSVHEAISASAQLESAESGDNIDMDLPTLKSQPNYAELVSQILAEANPGSQFLEALTEVEARVRADVEQEVAEQLEALEEENMELKSQLEVLAVTSTVDDDDDELDEANEQLNNGEEFIGETEADQRIAVLENQLSQRDADAWLQTACSKHRQGALILESCSGKASTIVEAEKIFKFTKDLVDKAGAKATATTSRGLPTNEDLLESSDVDDAPSDGKRGRSMLRHLAGVGDE